MFSWPDPGTRVTVRYRLPAGSSPPLSDAVGHLLAVDPVVRVQTKKGAVVEFSPHDVVALRVLTDAPVRTSGIRALEHAAAAAWPGVERAWLDGWLLRAGRGAGLAANSAMPLDISADVRTIPAIADWYERRGLTPRLGIADRLLRLPPGLAGEHVEQVMVCDVSDMASRPPDPSVTRATRPDDAWLETYGVQIPVDVLTAVEDGEVVFGTHPGGAVARAAVTEAPDGTRWVGLEASRPADGRAAQAAVALGGALLAWGAGHGATHAYMCVGDTGAAGVAESLGLRPHHRRRYLPARPGPWDTV